MSNLVLFVNGVQNPSEPHAIECSLTFSATRDYEILFSSTVTQHDNRAQRITLGKFSKFFYVSGFDLTPDREVDEEHICLPRQGIILIEARFKNPPSEPVKCFLCAEFPGHIEIDQSGNITVERIPLKLLKFQLNI